MISLRYFQRMMSGRGIDSNVAPASAAATARATSSTPVGIAPDVEQPADRRRRRGDDARFEVLGRAASRRSRRRARTAAARGVRSRRRSARTRPGCRDRPRPRARRTRRPSPASSSSTSTTSSARQSIARGIVDDRDRQRDRRDRDRRAACPWSRIASKCAPRAIGDDVVPVLEQPPGDHAADRAGAEDDDAHQSRSVPFAASMYAGFSPPPWTSTSAPFT